MTHGSLFNGISGFPLAAHWAGIETIWTCEIDPFCNAVSKKHFPNAEQFLNIHDLISPSYVDIISGGFPCQPFSVAGEGLGEADYRFLWPQMYRIVRIVKPKWVIPENVPGLISKHPETFEMVCRDLEIEGYSVFPFIIPAAGEGAPHKRDRIWIVAHNNSISIASKNDQWAKSVPQNWEKVWPEHCSGHKVASDTSKIRFKQSRDSRTRRAGLAHDSSPIEHANSQRRQESDFPGFAANPGKSDRGYYDRIPNWDKFPTQPPVCRRNDGVSNRVDRIKSLGNAIVPQVAYQIFKAIKEIEEA